MSSQKLLLVFVVEVLKDEETADIVDQSVFVKGMVVNGALVLPIVTNRMLHLKQIRFHSYS